MSQFTPYILTTLLSSVVILIMGICLLTVSMPKGPELRSYRVSRRFLASAYIILAAISLAGVFWKSQLHEDVTVALFQALLFTYALITLLNSSFVTVRRMLKQLLIISLIVALILFNTFALTEPKAILTYISQGAYFFLFGYYIWQFFREWNCYKRRGDNYFASNESSLLRWVGYIYAIVIVIGILAGLIVENNIWFILFIIFYTLTYIYLAVKYINYVTQFHRIAPIIVDAKVETKQTEISKESIRIALDKWIARKGFLSADVSLESLSQEFQINPTYLSRYINSTYGQNFRSWISSGRIAEAQTLITDREELSFTEIAELVGIPSSSTFYRQFVATTGMTPAEYRKRFGRG